jgi:hypothetical protein
LWTSTWMSSNWSDIVHPLHTADKLGVRWDSTNHPTERTGVLHEVEYDNLHSVKPLMRARSLAGTWEQWLYKLQLGCAPADVFNCLRWRPRGAAPSGRKLLSDNSSFAKRILVGWMSGGWYCISPRSLRLGKRAEGPSDSEKWTVPLLIYTLTFALQLRTIIESLSA